MKLISIGILTKNAGPMFKECLSRILNQEIELPYEIVILDSGSTDGTTEITAKAGGKIFTILPEEFSFGSSRDKLFSLCKGDFLVTLSQDAIPLDGKWLENLTKPLRDGVAEICQGFEQYPSDAFYWIKNNKFYFTRENLSFKKRYGHIGISCVNLAMTKFTWERVHFGPIPICEDKLFQKRATAVGLRALRCHDAKVIHGHQYGLLGLMQRCVNEGMGWRHLGERYKARDMLKDLCKFDIHGMTIHGIRTGEIRALSEILFPLIRPIGLFFGNRFLRDFWHAMIINS